MNQDAKAARQFGRKLTNLLNSQRGWKILERWDCGWTDGGCLVLAKALRLWLGAGKVVGVWEGDIQHHAVLSIGKWIVDGVGVVDSRSYVLLWSVKNHHRGFFLNPEAVRLADFDYNVASEQGVEEDCRLEKKVVSLLDSTFNPDRVRMALTA